jgi:hypothetical protein
LSSSPVYSRGRETKGPKEEHLSSSPVYSRVREIKGPKEEHLSSPPVFSGVRVTRSLVLCVCFVDRCLFLVGFVLLDL